MDISSDDLEMIKDWKIGETYTVIAKVKMTSIRQTSKWDMESPESYAEDKDPEKPKPGSVIACFEVQDVMGEGEKAADMNVGLEGFDKEYVAVKTFTKKLG